MGEGAVMASNDLGFNDAKLAWGNWDYVDLSHFTKMPGTSITASALSLMKGCGVKAQHPGVLAGVASFSAGIALHRMRRSHSKRISACVDIAGPVQAQAQDIRKDCKKDRPWLPVALKCTGAAVLIFAASRKVRKRWKTAFAAKTIKLDAPVKSAIQLDDAPATAPKAAIFAESCELGPSGKVQDSIQSLSTKAPSSAAPESLSSVASSASVRGRGPDKGVRSRSTPLSQMKHLSKGVQEDVGKVAFPIMHFKRIHCFEQASPFSSNVPTRSPSPCTRKEPQQGEQPKSRSPDPSKQGKRVKEIEETPIGAKTGESKRDLPQAPRELSNKNGQLVSRPGAASKPGAATQPKPAKPGDVQKREEPSPKPFASPRQASQASQAASQAASQTASQTATPPKDDKTAQSTSTQSTRAASSASPRQPGTSPRPGARPVEQKRPPGQDSHVKGPVAPTNREREPQTQSPRPTPSSNTQQDPTPVGGRQPSAAGSSSTAQKVPISQGGVGAPGASSHQSQNNQSSAVAGTDKHLQADAKGTLLLKDTPTTDGAKAPVKQAATHPVAKPQMRREPRASFYSVQKTDKTQIQSDRDEPPSLPVLPSKGGVYPLPGQHSMAPPLSQQYASALARRLHPAPSELTIRPSAGVPSPPLPASASGLLPSDGQEKTVSGVQSQGSLPPPKADPSSSSSAPVANKNGPTQSAQSSSGRPGSHAPDEDDYEAYSVYSGSSRSSSASHDEAGHDEGGKHSHSDYSSLSDGARSRSPSSGRQCGNDFLPDISMQVRAAKPHDQDRSHANRADDLCEFHVMDDEDAQDAMQDTQGTSLHQEYDQTLRRLGARRAPAPAQGLQRQVTH